jgi:hypothetical protein
MIWGFYRPKTFFKTDQVMTTLYFHSEKAEADRTFSAAFGRENPSTGYLPGYR